MADGQTTVKIGENTPEHVALRLMEIVARLEQRELWKTSDSKNPADRAWVLNTYAECLLAVRGFRNAPPV